MGISCIYIQYEAPEEPDPNHKYTVAKEISKIAHEAGYMAVLGDGDYLKVLEKESPELDFQASDGPKYPTLPQGYTAIFCRRKVTGISHWWTGGKQKIKLQARELAHNISQYLSEEKLKRNHCSALYISGSGSGEADQTTWK